MVFINDKYKTVDFNKYTIGEIKMKKVSMIINAALIVSLCLNAAQYYFNKDNEVNSDSEDVMFLKEVPNLYLHSSIDGVYAENFSATGPSAYINPYGINNNNSRITVLSGGDEYFTKIKIEGYVPSWYITNDNPNIYFKNINEEKYIIKETTAYYGASEDSGEVKVLSKGTAVEVKGEIDGWYYIRLMNGNYSLYPEMWVNKECVGDFSGDVINTEVKVREGTIGILKNDEESEEYILDSTMIGTIKSEDDKYYFVSFPGAFGLYIEKCDVEFLGD